MTEHAAVIADGGPTGLMLAAEMALAWVDVATARSEPARSPARARPGLTPGATNHRGRAACVVLKERRVSDVPICGAAI